MAAGISIGEEHVERRWGVWVSKIREAKTAKGSVPKGKGKRDILREEGRSQSENLGRDTEIAKPTRGPMLEANKGDQGETSETTWA